MKYEEANYVKDGRGTKIKVSNYTQSELEEMDQNGEFHCPGKDCDAK